jgi:hypothetical protein
MVSEDEVAKALAAQRASGVVWRREEVSEDSKTGAQEPGEGAAV